MAAQSLAAHQPLLAPASQGPDYGTHANSLHGHGQGHGTTIVHFAHGDPEDPRNWPRWKKWLMIGPILLIDLSVSWGASGFSPASKKFAEDFGLPSGLGTLGLSAYVLGLAFGPMTLAPLSEVRVESQHSCPLNILELTNERDSTTEDVRSTFTLISFTCAYLLYQH